MNLRRTGRLVIALALAAVSATAALAEFRMEKSLDLAPGGEFVLDSDVGGVEVVGTSRPGARLVVTSNRDDVESKFDFHYDVAPGRVEVTVDRKGGSKLFSWFGSSGSLRFAIEVPASTRLDISTAGGGIAARDIDAAVRLDTSGGSIEASRIRGAVHADTSGGRIEIDEVDGDVVADTSGGGISIEGVRGAVKADTSGGSIDIARVDGDVVADTSGGSIRLEKIGGRVDGDTSGGSITASFTPGNANGGSLSTSGGGVHVTLDPGVGLEIDAASSGGGVVANVPVTVRGNLSRTSLRGTIGGGGATLKLRASGGKIRIDPL